MAKGGDWMEKEADRESSAGTKGAFSKKAAKAGESTSKFASEKSSAPGKLGKQARMAKMFAKGRAAKSQSK